MQWYIELLFQNKVCRKTNNNKNADVENNQSIKFQHSVSSLTNNYFTNKGATR